ncbi:MAG: murein biosynthesis integral membrane protein MurJ [Patescibacteria group bacterium]
MERFIKKTSDFIFSRQESIFSSAVLLSFMIVLASLAGFLRYRILAGYFTTQELDVFFASFRIPDLIFEILITGALTSTFIPIFVKYKAVKKELTENISSIINLISLILGVFIVFASLFMDRIIPVFTPGYDAVKIRQITDFSRILIIGQLPFLVASNFLTGLGQANKTFFIPAVAPILYNVAIILVTVLFYKTLLLSAPVWGVVVGAALMFAIQLPLFFKSEFSYALVLKKTKGLTEFFRMVVPRAFTVIVAQLDATIDLTLATLLGNGAYTVFYLAQRLQLLPVSVIGIAFGQASLPYLTEIFHEKRLDEFKKIVTDSILNLFFLSIPVSVFFIFARTPMIRLFFGGQKFDWDSTVLTAVTLSYFSLSLPFHTIYYLLTRCFYSIMDSRTPFFVSILSILVNTGLSLIFVFVFHYPVWALAISFSAAITLNSTILFFVLGSRIGKFDLIFIFRELAKMATAAAVSGTASYLLMKLLDGLIFDTSYTINVFILLFFTFAVFISLYLFLGWLMDVKELYLITHLMLKAKEYQKKFTELYTQHE